MNGCVVLLVPSAAAAAVPESAEDAARRFLLVGSELQPKAMPVSPLCLPAASDLALLLRLLAVRGNDLALPSRIVALHAGE